MTEREEEELLVQRLLDGTSAPLAKVLECLEMLGRAENPAGFVKMLRAVVEINDIRHEQHIPPAEFREMIDAAMDELDRNEGYYDALSKQHLRKMLCVVD